MNSKASVLTAVAAIEKSVWTVTPADQLWVMFCSQETRYSRLCSGSILTMLKKKMKV